MKNIAFFVNYSRDNKVSNQTKYALENIRGLYDKVIIISNSKLTKKNANILETYCDTLIVRKNVGFDFAAWRDGIKSVGWRELAEYDTVTLLNDTCLFPLFPMDKLIKKFNSNKNIDFWGASIHRQTKTGMPGSDGPVPEHIQSYFMVFKRNVVKSKVFQKFWDEVVDFKNVNEVIDKYETRLTSTLSKSGFKYDAIYNPKNYDDKGIIDAVYQIPDVLVKRGFPFIKVKVLNKSNVGSIINSISIAKSKYPTKLIAIKNKSPKGILSYLINNTHWLFLIIAFIFSTIFMAITPVGFGGDEESHIYRSYHISTGHLFTEDLGGGMNGLIPVNLSEATKFGYATASSSRFGSTIIGRQDIAESEALYLDELSNAPLNSYETRTEKFSNTNPYSPTMYIGAALGFKISSIMNLSVGWSVFLARLINAIPFLAVSFFALFILKGTKSRWLVFFVLLFPTVISYVATINGDPYNIASVMLFLAIFIKCIDSFKTVLDKRDKFIIVVSTLLLATAKLPSALLSSLLILVPAKKFGGRNKKSALITGIFLLVVFFTSLTMFTGSRGEYNTGVKDQALWILHNPVGTLVVYVNTLFTELPDYINRSIGVMGRNGVFVYPVIITAVVVWTILIGLWLDKNSKKNSIILFLTGIVLCFLVMTLLYLADNKTGAKIIWGVHGKYFTPFIPFMAYGLKIVPINITSKGRYMEYGTVILSTILLTTSVIMYSIALH